jgi:hypothetical protein
LVGREVLSTERQYVLFRRLGSSRYHDEGDHDLASAFRYDLHNAGIRDRRMAGQYSFDVPRVHRPPIQEETVRNPIDDQM